MCLTEESSFIPSIGQTWHTSDKDCKKKWLLRIFIPPEAALYRSSLSIPKCDFNKVEKVNFIEITLWHGCSSVYLLHIFRTPFLKNTFGGLLLLPWMLLNPLLPFYTPWKHQKNTFVFLCFQRVQLEFLPEVS